METEIFLAAWQARVFLSERRYHAHVTRYNHLVILALIHPYR